jgi:hypothetical protein
MANKIFRRCWPRPDFGELEHVKPGLGKRSNLPYRRFMLITLRHFGQLEPKPKEGHKDYTNIRGLQQRLLVELSKKRHGSCR